MEKNLAKTYNPKDFEDRIYEMWEQKGAFRAEVDKNKKPYTIVMPPPNITGQLHMGHALDQTLQDVLTRWKRMQGYSALWLPGSDHASIATEVKVVDKIRAEEGLEKEDLGREEFLKRAWAWKEEYGGRITKQCRKLGDSCDWERERFTMDEGCNRAVRTLFVQLYEKGLIYRGNRLINWCPQCGTSLSDAEVEHEDKNGKYWYFRYDAAEEGGEPMVVATSRPETMFGDVAIAVHPDDERYKDMVGKKVILPLVGTEIPIIADPYPDPEKGTGAVKITPAHDPNDFEVGQRHNLDMPCCINLDATMNELAGKYEGMDRYECRKAWVEDIDKAGFLVKTEEKVIPMGECYRCHTTVESMLSDQWFVKMEELAKPAIEAAKKGDLKHVPERFEKIYLHWLEEIRDWCISRQLWWGHRIPAYYCKDCGEMTVSRETVCTCPKCGSTNVEQDPDTLDTWFSSALWPFSTLGWPDKTPELDYFYPTDVLVTGYDIIFFWVIRMIFSGYEHMGKKPFGKVLFHGLVRDDQGRKMSKSLGNGIDPLEVIDKYGADALRYTLITGNAPGNDMRFYWSRVEASRNFANKVWNASRFIMMNDPDNKIKATDARPANLTDADKWILSKMNGLIKEVTENMEKYELGIAVAKLNDFIWEEFCDWYIEMVKPRLYNDADETKTAAIWTLKTVLIDALKLLHPYMPFITEEIFCNIQDEEESIMISSWPVYDENNNFAAEEKAIETIKEAVRNIRNLRADMNVAPSRKALVYVVSASEDVKNIFSNSLGFFGTLAYASEVKVQADKAGIPEDAVSTVIPDAVIYIPFAELVDIDKEIERLKKEEGRLQGEIKRCNGMLNNEKFTSKAPQAKIDEEKAKLVKYTQMLEQVTERLETLSK